MQDKRVQRAKMMKMISDWEKSGSRQRDYCTAHKIAYHNFHYWYRIYRTEQSSTGSFVPVKVASASHLEQITLLGTSGIKIQIPLTEQTIGFVRQLLLS
jgi:hypothetical protein